jgi:hypothetical protein
VTVRRPFVITPYSASASGVLQPALPKVGPCSSRDRAACALGVDHVRERKTGPCFPLTVLVCETHGVGFTLYPPGHVPYGRAAVATVAPDGGVILEGPKGAAAFEGTVFAAALSASEGVAWDRARPGGSARWWGTQWRRLAVAQRICGLAPEIGEAERESAAAALGVALLLLREQAWRTAAAPGYRRRGKAVRAVLESLRQGPCVLSRLMASGHLAGLWGAPLWWEAQAGQLRSWSFRGVQAVPG